MSNERQYKIGVICTSNELCHQTATNKRLQRTTEMRTLRSITGHRLHGKIESEVVIRVKFKILLDGSRAKGEYVDIIMSDNQLAKIAKVEKPDQLNDHQSTSR